MKQWLSHYAHILLVIPIFFSFCLPVISAETTKLTTSISHSLDMAEQGDLQGAEHALDSLTKADVSGPLLLTARGILKLKQDKFKAAESLFRSALSQNPQQVAALWGLSICLLQRSHVYEAAPLMDRAAALAPNSYKVKALQAYIYLQLGQITDAALAGKEALEGGEQSSFLMATLAKIHYRMGFDKKAVEFAGFSAKSFFRTDLRNLPDEIYLPLSMKVADTPAVLSDSAFNEPAILAPAMEPDFEPSTNAPEMEIVSPKEGSSVSGVQRIKLTYPLKRNLSFVTLLVDGVLSGMSSKPPFKFSWDADAVAPGEHQLTVRAYDENGFSNGAKTITVITAGGKQIPQESFSANQLTLQEKMLSLTLPSPSPLSLYTNLGLWQLELKEIPQAITALEKAVAIDPANESLLSKLQTLYKEQGLHPISPLGEVWRGMETGKKQVALTFDDGPNPLYTPIILEELARFDARATFFLVGKMVRRNPDLTKQIIADGHELANHTYHHPNLTKLSSELIISELLQNRALIKDLTGRNTYLFRPPGGSIDAAVAAEVKSLDYNTVYWSINAGDFKKSPPAEQAQLILSKVQDGSIVLLHNGIVDGTMDILHTLLTELRKRGYSCVTVSELLKSK